MLGFRLSAFGLVVQLWDLGHPVRKASGDAGRRNNQLSGVAVVVARRSEHCPCRPRSRYTMVVLWPHKSATGPTCPARCASRAHNGPARQNPASAVSSTLSSAGFPHAAVVRATTARSQWDRRPAQERRAILQGSSSRSAAREWPFRGKAPASRFARSRRAGVDSHNHPPGSKAHLPRKGTGELLAPSVPIWQSCSPAAGFRQDGGAHYRSRRRPRHWPSLIPGPRSPGACPVALLPRRPTRSIPAAEDGHAPSAAWPHPEGAVISVRKERPMVHRTSPNQRPTPKPTTPPPAVEWGSTCNPSPRKLRIERGKLPLDAR